MKCFGYSKLFLLWPYFEQFETIFINIGAFSELDSQDDLWHFGLYQIIISEKPSIWCSWSYFLFLMVPASIWSKLFKKIKMATKWLGKKIGNNFIWILLRRVKATQITKIRGNHSLAGLHRPGVPKKHYKLSVHFPYPSNTAVGDL